MRLDRLTKELASPLKSYTTGFPQLDRLHLFEKALLDLTLGEDLIGEPHQPSPPRDDRLVEMSKPPCCFMPGCEWAAAPHEPSQTSRSGTLQKSPRSCGCLTKGHPGGDAHALAPLRFPLAGGGTSGGIGLLTGLSRPVRQVGKQYAAKVGKANNRKEAEAIEEEGLQRLQALYTKVGAR